MDGCIAVAVIDESNDRLATPLHVKDRSWGKAVVANERGGRTVGIDLLLKFLDIDLIVVDELSVDGVFHGTWKAAKLVA